MEENIVEEVINEEIIETSSSSEPSVESSQPVPEQVFNVPDLEQNEQTDNEILMEYIKSELAKRNLENEEVEVEQIEQQEVVEEEVIPDYTQQLDDIKEELSSISIYMENYGLDNQMDSNINDITLTNSLLVVTIICVLFTATLNFARRIF